MQFALDVNLRLILGATADQKRVGYCLTQQHRAEYKIYLPHVKYRLEFYLQKELPHLRTPELTCTKVL